MTERQGFSEVIRERFPGGEEMFDHLFKGYFLDLAEREGRAFQMVVEDMVWSRRK